MARSPRRLVLVTGTPRSGTTAVGDLLAAAPGARELYEPFNRHVGMIEVGEDFPVPGSATCPESRFEALVDRIERLDLTLRSGVFPHDHGWRRVMKRVTGSRTTLTTRLARAHGAAVDRLGRTASGIGPLDAFDTIIWKDPFAVFAVDAVRARGVPVLVTVRNPWATAASFKRLGWGFDAADVARRLTEAGRPPALADTALADTASAAVNGARNWRLAHDVVLDAHDAGPGIHLVDIDAVVSEPLASYQRLYEVAGLTWTAATRAAVEATYAERTAAARPDVDRAHVKDRDLSAVNTYWSEVLDDAEVAAIDTLCGPTWERIQAAFGGPVG